MNPLFPIQKPLLKLLLLFSVSIFTSGCASIFIPHNQTITLNTQKDSAVVYMNGEKIGRGASITKRIAKEGAKQLTVKTPGYKDHYAVLIPKRKPIAFWPLFAIDMLTFYGGIIDVAVVGHFDIYPKKSNVIPDGKLTYRRSDQKYIDMEAIKLDIDNVKTDLQDYLVRYTPRNMQSALDNAEKRQDKLNKKNKKLAEDSHLDEQIKEMKTDDTRFSASVYNSLRVTGYVDTVNRIFKDQGNTIRIQGAIRKVNMYTVYSYTLDSYRKAKIMITWYIKNTYGEKIDSVDIWSYSGDFSYSYAMYGDASIFGDAVDYSFLALMKDAKFQRWLKTDTLSDNQNQLLSLNSPRHIITDAYDAPKATVIIKRKDKQHGSGFAITNDGYILTNYHVIAGEIVDQPAGFVVLGPKGQEWNAKVVRYNKNRDIALIKVDTVFEKAFFLSNQKSFEMLGEVYAIGAPKSIELGQTVSMGILSNERITNNNNLLQLSMSINGGNSGGPLFDKSGKLHGIVRAKLVGYSTEGVGFAVPSYLVSAYLNIQYR